MKITKMETTPGSKSFIDLHMLNSTMIMNHPGRLLGICGYARVGKTTTAVEVLNLIGASNRGEVLPFAAPVKDIAFQMGWDGQKDERGRRLLQMIGTEIGRAYDPDIWVDKWTAKVLARWLDHVPLIIADDVRFQNEVDRIRKLGGKVIRLKCPGRELKLDHASEKPESLDVDFDLPVVARLPPVLVAGQVIELLGW